MVRRILFDLLDSHRSILTHLTKIFNALMQPVINNQIGSLKESATLFINQLALKLRSEGQNICHLGFGESPFPVPEPMRIALQENAYRKQYISGYGLPELRKAVAGFFKSEFGYNYSFEKIFIGETNPSSSYCLS